MKFAELLLLGAVLLSGCAATTAQRGEAADVDYSDPPTGTMIKHHDSIGNVQNASPDDLSGLHPSGQGVGKPKG